MKLHLGLKLKKKKQQKTFFPVLPKLITSNSSGWKRIVPNPDFWVESMWFQRPCFYKSHGISYWWGGRRGTTCVCVHLCVSYTTTLHLCALFGLGNKWISTWQGKLHAMKLLVWNVCYWLKWRRSVFSLLKKYGSGNSTARN